MAKHEKTLGELTRDAWLHYTCLVTIRKAPQNFPVAYERTYLHRGTACNSDAADGHIRPPARQSPDQCDRSMQYSMFLLHAGRGRAIRSARRDSFVRGNRALRARCGVAGRD